jgi:hypothetical protein
MSSHIVRLSERVVDLLSASFNESQTSYMP